jgi:hypothetical protein
MESKLALNLTLFILISYIALRLIGKRLRSTGLSKPDHDTEPFSLSNSAESELTYIIDNSTTAGITRVQGVSKPGAGMQLKEYCIKASHGSATTGNYVHLDMVKHVLSRGCRLLDFDVFYVNEGKTFLPKVGFSTDINNHFIESKNSILLDDVFGTIVANAFSQVSPNRTDPLFINLRIKSNDSAVYSAVAKSLDARLKSLLYPDKVTKDTLFKDIMGKIVIVIDKTIRRDYKTYAKCDNDDTSCYDLDNYINIESGSEDWNLYHYTDLLEQAASPSLIKDDNTRTTVKTITMAIPDTISSPSNPRIDEFITKYACQIVACRFHILDDNLQRYEMMFDNNSGGCVPLAVALAYTIRLRDE